MTRDFSISLGNEVTGRMILRGLTGLRESQFSRIEIEVPVVSSIIRVWEQNGPNKHMTVFVIVAAH